MIRAVLVLVALIVWLSMDEAVAAAPPCVPYLPGTPDRHVGELEVVRTPVRIHGFWFCEDKLGNRRHYGSVCDYSQNCMSADVVAGIKAILAVEGGQRVQKFYDLYRLDTNCADPAVRAGTDWRATSCREHWQLATTYRAAWEKALPPAPVWKVKAVSAPATTRPAYALTVPSGSLGSRTPPVRGSKVMARAVPGTRCNAAAPMLWAGADAYMSYDATGYVALCSKQ